MAKLAPPPPPTFLWMFSIHPLHCSKGNPTTSWATVSPPIFSLCLLADIPVKEKDLSAGRSKPTREVVTGSCSVKGWGDF